MEVLRRSMAKMRPWHFLRKPCKGFLGPFCDISETIDNVGRRSCGLQLCWQESVVTWVVQSHGSSPRYHPIDTIALSGDAEDTDADKGLAKPCSMRSTAAAIND